jgi:hypothetical protein
VGLGLRGQQCIQQPGLAPAEADVPIFRRTRSCQHADPPEPLLGNHAVGAVVEPDHVLATAQGLQQRGELRRRLAILHAAVQLEPVHAGGYLDVK